MLTLTDEKRSFSSLHITIKPNTDDDVFACLVNYEKLEHTEDRTTSTETHGWAHKTSVNLTFTVIETHKMKIINFKENNGFNAKKRIKVVTPVW